MLTIERLCCMRLHTAGVVIGWVGTALTLISLVLQAVVISRLDQIVKYIIDNQGPNSTLDEETIRSVAIALIAIYMTLTVVNLISSVFLIAGTMKERHLMLVPWLINNGFALVISFLNLISVLWFSISLGDSFGNIIGVLVISGIGFTIQFFIWTAIYSLFRNIRASREQQQQLITNKAGTAYPSYTRI